MYAKSYRFAELLRSYLQSKFLHCDVFLLAWASTQGIRKGAFINEVETGRVGTVHMMLYKDISNMNTIMLTEVNST